MGRVPQAAHKAQSIIPADESTLIRGFIDLPFAQRNPARTVRLARRCPTAAWIRSTTDPNRELSLLRLGLDSALPFDRLAGASVKVGSEGTALLRRQLRVRLVDRMLVVRSGGEHAELDAEQLGRADRGAGLTV